MVLETWSNCLRQDNFQSDAYAHLDVARASWANNIGRKLLAYYPAKCHKNVHTFIHSSVLRCAIKSRSPRAEQSRDIRFTCSPAPIGLYTQRNCANEHKMGWAKNAAYSVQYICIVIYFVVQIRYYFEYYVMQSLQCKLKFLSCSILFWASSARRHTHALTHSQGYKCKWQLTFNADGSGGLGKEGKGR